MNWGRVNGENLISARGSEQIGGTDEGDAGPAAFMRVMCEKCSHIGSVPTGYRGRIKCKRCGRRGSAFFAAKKMREFRQRESHLTPAERKAVERELS
jgi:hypothetical protein